MINWDLIRRKLEETTTSEDEERIERWLQEDEKNKELLEELLERWSKKDDDHNRDYDPEAAYREFLTKIEVEESDKEVPKPKKTTAVIKIRRSWAVAAFVALLMVASWLLYTTQPPVKEDVVYLTKSTERGQKLDTHLPDGSTVKLNAESSITYPETFDYAEQRKVTLDGEAFFEVVSDTSKLFTVQSGDLVTTVSGTSFNINAYPEKDQLAVTVATGEVQVRPATDSTDIIAKTVTLTPAEQAQFSVQSGQLTKRTVSLDTVITWKDGILRFEGNTLSEIVPELERWYGVTIALKDTQQDLCDLRLTFDNLSLTQALEQLQLTTGINHRKVQPDGYEISGVGCES